MPAMASALGPISPPASDNAASPPTPAAVPMNAAPPPSTRRPAEPHATIAAVTRATPAATGAPPEDAARPEQDDVARFAEIQSALTPHEAMMADALVAELTPGHQRAWLAELRSLPYPDAVASVRAVLASSATGPRPAGRTHDAPSQPHGGAA